MEFQFRALFMNAPRYPARAEHIPPIIHCSYPDALGP